MRYFFFIFIVLLAGVLLAAGTRGHKFSKPPFELLPDMDHQAKIKYQTRSDFFSDAVGSRLPVAHTQPMGYSIPAQAVSSLSDAEAKDAAYFATGRFGDFWGHGLPATIEVNEGFLATGAQYYGIYCTVCHGETGNGKGPTSQFGIANAASFHIPDFTNPESPAYRTDGSIFDTITHGKGLMGSYGANITPYERWAIVGYIRSLQAAGAGAQ